MLSPTGLLKAGASFLTEQLIQNNIVSPQQQQAAGNQGRIDGEIVVSATPGATVQSAKAKSSIKNLNVGLNVAPEGAL